MKHIIAGWIIVAFSYFLSLFLGFTLYPLIFGEPWDYNRVASGYFIGAFVVFIPYITAGLFIRKSKFEPIKTALLISIIPAIFEKVFIYFIGASIAPTTHEGNNRTVMQFITGEAVPYFTPLYFAAGIVSVVLCMWVAGRK